MKLWRSKRGKWLIALVAAALLIWAGTWLSDWFEYMNSPQMWAKTILAQNSGSLDPIAVKQGGGTNAYFRYPRSPDPETDIFIEYIPEDRFPFQETLDSSRAWHLVSSSEDKWRWEGGLNGIGYLDVERLQPKWFYAEYFNPT